MIRNLKSKIWGHGILYPHYLKKWGDAASVTPSNWARGCGLVFLLKTSLVRIVMRFFDDIIQM